MVHKYFDSSIPIHSNIFCMIRYSKDILDVPNLLFQIACSYHASAKDDSNEALKERLLVHGAEEKAGMEHP